MCSLISTIILSAYLDGMPFLFTDNILYVLTDPVNQKGDTWVVQNPEQRSPKSIVCLHKEGKPT